RATRSPPLSRGFTTPNTRCFWASTNRWALGCAGSRRLDPCDSNGDFHSTAGPGSTSPCSSNSRLVISSDMRGPRFGKEHSVMGRQLPAVAVAAAFCLSGPALAAVKLGYVDLQRALGELEEGKAAKARLQAILDAKQKEIDSEQEALRKEKEQID